MLKRTVVLGAVAVMLLGLFFGRTHLTTAVGMAKQTIKDNVPVDFEIKRAREMIKGLQPEIERNMHLIAREETEVAKLEKQVSKSEDRLAKDRDGILRLKGDLDSGSQVFVYAGHSYSAKQVKEDLTHRFDEFKTQEATTDSLRKILTARQTSLTAAREKLEGMLSAKRQLEVDVENLEARLKMVEVAQTTSDFNFDDSQLSQTKELISEIGDRIEVAERLVNADTTYQDRIQLEEPADSPNRDITKEITNYFGERRAEIEALVQSEKSN
jgi:predicted  nucleic acid-binding Zn-ribbon protein